ncbi:MAG: disulfide bond formation protein DsbD, partial [Pirellulaceae bacterium]
TCIYNFNTVLNTEAMAEELQQLNIVPMKADWSEPNPEIKSKLSELKSNSIPLLAIYPAGAPSRPIVLPDVLTESQVKAALKQAASLADTDELANAEESKTTSVAANLTR